MSLNLPALSFKHPGNDSFTLNTPELTLSDVGYACVIGRNGSGKSSFGEALASVVQGPAENRWYYLPQYLDRFLFAEHILEQLGIMLAQQIDRDLLLEVLVDLGFAHAAELLEFPFILMSGGERRRMALACVFYLKPKFMILDEPDIGITEKENVVLLRKIGILKPVETRIILISHNYRFVAASTNLICLSGGRIDRAGKTSDLLNETDLNLKDYGVRF